MTIGAAPQGGFAPTIENFAAAAAALGIMVLPLSEIVLRRLFSTGIPGSAPLTTHLTLVVGLLGGAIAARDGKLLALASGTLMPDGRLRRIASIVVAAIGSSIATLFACGGAELLQVHRAGGKEIALGVPVWIADLAFPVAFALIAMRMVLSAAKSIAGRSAAALGVVAGGWLWLHPQAALDASPLLWLSPLIVAAILGMPIFALLGGAAAVLFLVQGDSPANAVIGGYDQLTSTDLPAIPLFTLAGFVLAEGHASARLLRVFRAGFGWMPGGTAVVTAVVSAFFTALTGGSGVTILALGGLLFSTLRDDGYRDRFALGLVTTAGSLGLLFPPALPLMLYGVVAGVAIGDLFIGGLLPGGIMLAAIMALGIREGLAVQRNTSAFALRDAITAFADAKWELLMPVVILGSLATGATTVQSSALAAGFALIVQCFIHRELKSPGEVLRVVSAAIAMVGGVLLILAVAVGLTTYLIDAQVPMRMIDLAGNYLHSQAAFLLALNAFLILVGCLMDVFSAIVVVVPLVAPIAATFGVHPVHLGIIFVANLELGYLTPPVGLNLFLASSRFDRTVFEIARATLPMLLVLAVVVLLITYVPALTLFLVAR